MSGSVHPLLCRTRSRAQTRILLRAPGFEGQDLKGGPGAELLQLEQSNQVGSFSPGEKTTGDGCHGKAELLPNTEMFPDLFTNIWCSFLDGVQTEIQPHASATSCPPPHPRLLHPGEQQGWEELVRGEGGIGMLLSLVPGMLAPG